MVVHQIKDPETNETLIIDLDIPGQLGWTELIGMARLAKQVPPNGVVVETGSLYGRSSFVWAKNVHPTVTVYCIDPWEREQWIVDIVEKPQKVDRPFSLEAFQYYTRDCPNIRTIKGRSPDAVQGTWNQWVDLYFDDADHNEPGLSRNRDFWTRWVKPGGVFCGDEYNSDFPECLRKTYELAMEWGVPVHSAGFFWWMRKPSGPASGQQGRR